MQKLQPIYCVDLFPGVNALLLDLLRGLSPEDWMRPTVCSQWDVKDVATHILDGMMRRLSLQRDGYSPGTRKPARSYTELVAYINRMNMDWTNALRRVSPIILIQLLEVTGREFHAFFETLDPHGPAIFPVAWAGEEYSENWFDIARDYTEQWVHQQQIRDAVGALGPLTDPTYGPPAFDTFMRGLPYAFRNTAAPDGTCVHVEVLGDAGGQWFVVRENNAWQLTKATDAHQAASVHFDPDSAWRVISKPMSAEDVRSTFQNIETKGEEWLTNPALELTSVMA